MRKSKFSESQIAGILQEVEAGVALSEAARKHGIERFNGTYRLEVLDAYQLVSLDQARDVTRDWIPVYNEQRVHRAIGHLPPLEFKQKRQQLSLLSTGMG
jgi:transposase InsO family protein